MPSSAILFWPWTAVREAAESLDLAYREAENTPPGEIDPAHLVELAEALQRAMRDSTTDPRVQAVCALVGSMGAAARLLTADRKLLLNQVDRLREQVEAERAFMREKAAELGETVARLTVALGEAVGHTGQLAAGAEALSSAGGAV